MLGYKFNERFPRVFGGFYKGILSFFGVATFFYFLLAIVSPQAVSSIVITPPTAANASLIVPSGITGNRGAPDGKYPLCSQNYEGLSSIDLGLLATLAYVPGADMESSLLSMFNNTNLQNVSLIAHATTHTINYLHARFRDVGSTKQQVDVVAIRGTSNDEEAFADTYLFSSITTMQAINFWLPLLQVLPKAFVQAVIDFIALGPIAGPQPFKWTDEYVSGLKSEGLNPIITGHSLGGAIGQIVSAKNAAPGLFFSPTGMKYTSRRFGISLMDLETYVTTVVPIKDAVPNVDTQHGSVNYIDCVSGVAGCHSLERTVCSLYAHCGDLRGRGFTGMCAEFDVSRAKNQDSEPYQYLPWMFVGILVIAFCGAVALIIGTDRIAKCAEYTCAPVIRCMVNIVAWLVAKGCCCSETVYEAEDEI